MIKIVHAADIHVGMKYSSAKYAKCRNELRQARIESLARVVQQANEHHADFLVIAGDLFDDTEVEPNSVDRKSIGAVARELAAFEGLAALILPGNHDHVCTGDSVWGTLQRELDDQNAERVYLLLDAKPRDMTVNDASVRFYPCPCTSKTSPDHAIGWVQAAERKHGALHIGIAHGNLEGLGLDREKRYFNMTRAELEATGVDLWLLGHVHRPSPAHGGNALQKIFMSGTTAPEDVKSNHEGSAWLLEIEGNTVRSHQMLATGKYRFNRLEATLNPTDGIGLVVEELKRGERADRVLDLVLDGELLDHQYDELMKLLSTQEEQDEFLLFTCKPEPERLRKREPASHIVRAAPAGTKTREFLEQLAASTHADDVFLAEKLARNL
jgi:exonuclease SbcD